MASGANAAARRRIGLELWGAVQGVGFRPFVHRLAVSERLGGSVRNTGWGVALEVEGAPRAIDRFLARLDGEVRPPANVHGRSFSELAPVGQQDFRIAPSSMAGSAPALVLPDLATCPDCRKEIFAPGDRRYRYPFTSCVSCGPRYSIVEAMPFDRERTAMRHFPLCAACRAEYEEPASRRYHAETIACPDCGPNLALKALDGALLASGEAALASAMGALRGGAIVAFKGVGGFQLLVDARDEAAVALLRKRKCRPARPFAVMVGDLAMAQAIAAISPAEEALLTSAAAPIVLLRATEGAIEGAGSIAPAIAPSVAPGNPWLGLMLPASPLHHLLMDGLGFPVVATSGNRSGEPIAVDDAQALAGLGAGLAAIADIFLTHDRPIVQRVDDSVVRVIAGEPMVLRCARGYAPLPLVGAAGYPGQEARPLIALGGHHKNSIAVASPGRIVLGPHVGNLDAPEARAAFSASLEAMTRLHGIAPEGAACDSHPDYHTSHFAARIGLPVARVPHHLAHVLAGMVDNGLDGPMLGVAWDGTGHGPDGIIRGGEFLLLGQDSWRRAAYFLPFRLLGGEAAMRDPRRSALGALHAILGDALFARSDLPVVADFSHVERTVLRGMLARGANAPLTSSVGRLFDAVAALLGLCERASFEGEAAMAVEFLADRARAAFALPAPVASPEGAALVIDWRPMLSAMIDALSAQTPPEALAAGFHEWLGEAIILIARQAGVADVLLTGGCFQNARLAELAVARLREAGFRPSRHRRVPPNDGGLAVGQAAAAARAMHEEEA